MSGVRDLIPEAISFMAGLMLSTLGVPSIPELLLMVAVKIQEIFPSTIGAISIFTIHLLIWFSTFEVMFRVLPALLKEIGSK